MSRLWVVLVAGLAACGGGGPAIRDLIVQHQHVAFDATCNGPVESYTLNFSLSSDRILSKISGLQIAPTATSPLNPTECADLPWIQTPETAPIEIYHYVCPGQSYVNYPCNGNIVVANFTPTAATTGNTLTLTLKGFYVDKSAWTSSSSASFQ